jgi:hypothetical protein
LGLFPAKGNQFSDPDSRRRDPAGVMLPAGPFSDILRAWHGELGYDPALVQAPIVIE